MSRLCLIVVLLACGGLTAAGGTRSSFPEKVLYVRGNVECPQGVMTCGDGLSTTLRWERGGDQPVVAYDFGGRTVGGYAVFKVSAFMPTGKGVDGGAVGCPVLRLSYSTHPDGLSETGCFSRENCAHYLGMDFDNPVLPANVNRHETYTIPRTGTFVAPLLQGQERYVRLQLDTPGTAVSVESLEIRNVGVHATDSVVGSFRCSDERVNRTWDMSVWTCNLAAIPNHDAWRVVDGALLPRKLERGECAGLCERARMAKDGTYDVDFELRTNPHYDSALGLMVRAADSSNGVLVVLSQPAVCRILLRRDGTNRLIRETVLPRRLVDGVAYRLSVSTKGRMVNVSLDGRFVASVALPGLPKGDRFGFYVEKEWWPVVHSLSVKSSDGAADFTEDFSSADEEGRLPGWIYSRSFRFLADGGKRDRLVWSGDLWWAERSCFYGYSPTWPYLRESLKLLAFNQNPEGYVWAAPWGENAQRPKSGEYGHFPSDEFSAWFVPVAWDYYLYTADRKTAEEIYLAVRQDIAYLSGHCRSDGIFEQRVETSCHANSLDPGDVRHRLYMNILLWMCYRDGVRFAQELGYPEDATDWMRRRDALADSIRLRFKEKDGSYKDVLEREGLWHFSRAMALASGFATKEEAVDLGKMSPSGLAGKFHLLCMRGKFEYGFAETAFNLLESGTWFELSDPSWAGAQCCTECGFLVRNDWWDESHPDTSAAGVISTYLLGVEPTEPGYRRFRFRPRFVSSLSFAEGAVPTPHGMIEARWSMRDGAASCWLSVPEGTLAEIETDDGIRTVNAGWHEFLRRHVEFTDPTIVSVEQSGRRVVEVPTYRSKIYINKDAVFEYVVDLGTVRDLSGVELVAGKDDHVPGRVGIDIAESPNAFVVQKDVPDVQWKDGRLFVDLRTVGGSLRARFVKLRFQDVAPSWNGALKTYYQVSLEMIRVKYND